ncbi:hypothetical protein [Pseudonocardia nigra]|uniref:hypothetical protein n=1 Tax=Pseudonocardia nigra TaxID=1921578 RepID=UPI001C5EF76A|nr:hypothetical protein [Pseudonocardia nigra]
MLIGGLTVLAAGIVLGVQSGWIRLERRTGPAVAVSRRCESCGRGTSSAPPPLRCPSCGFEHRDYREAFLVERVDEAGSWSLPCDGCTMSTIVLDSDVVCSNCQRLIAEPNSRIRERFEQRGLDVPRDEEADPPIVHNSGNSELDPTDPLVRELIELAEAGGFLPAAAVDVNEPGRSAPCSTPGVGSRR